MLCALFVLGALTIIYWRYPAQDVVTEESWSLYSGREAMKRPDLLALQRPSEWLVARRGLSFLARYAITELHLRPEAIHYCCIGLQWLNLALFAWIVLQIAGTSRLAPTLVVATLYPFASGAHFWQIALLHHAAIFMFLCSLALFLRFQSLDRPTGWLRGCLGVGSLLCYWLSLWMMEHAILFSLFFVYLLFFSGRGALQRWRRASLWLGLGYLLVNVAALICFTRGGVAHLNMFSTNHRTTYHALAATVHVTPAVLSVLIAGVNVVLFVSSAAWTNTGGLLMYPLLNIARHVIRLTITPLAVFAVGSLACLGTWILTMLSSWPRHQSDAVSPADRHVLNVGLLWTALAYLPMSFSFAYPRMVGQVADRVNMLALFGVSLCFGVLIPRWLRTSSSSGAWGRGVRLLGCAAGIALLVTHLRIQRAFWVDSSHKERQLLAIAYETARAYASDGKSPVVLLRRESPIRSLRDRLRDALQQPRRDQKAAALLRILFARHFTAAGEMEVTAFHLEGIPLFGGAPNGAQEVVDGYAQRLGVEPLVVYKIDYGFFMRRKDGHMWIGYGNHAQSRYDERRYDPIVLVIHEPSFTYGGPVLYHVRRAQPGDEQYGTPDIAAAEARPRTEMAMRKPGGAI